VALTSGSRLGSYEITGPLGAGGMGEVYRGRDTRLKRDVALKVLPESVSQDPDALARFIGTIAIASNQSDAPTAPTFQVVLNWLEELKQRVPVK